MILSGVYTFPELEPATTELAILSHLKRIHDRSPSAARRALEEASSGQLQPGDVERLVFDGWRQESVAARRRGLNEQDSFRLGGNVFTFFKKELRSVERDAKSAVSAEDLIDLRDRLMSLSDSVDSPFVREQLDTLQTPRGRSLSWVLGEGLKSVTFSEPDNAAVYGQFASSLANTLDSVDESSVESELAWLPYQYDDEIENLSSLYQSGDTESYKQGAVSLRNDIDLMDPKLAGDAGRLIVEQADVALEQDNFDVFHQNIIELNKSIRDWIADSQSQVAGAGS